MRMRRGRAFVRMWPAGKVDGPAKAAIIGIAECPLDVSDEKIHGFAAMNAGGTTMLTPTGHVGRIEGDIADHDVGSILTQCDWPRPSKETGLDGGGLLLRRTRAPAADGTVACVIVGLLSGDVLRDQTILELSGDDAGNVRIEDERCVKHLATNGETLGHVMHRPLWGWDGEPWGLVSSLRLDVTDQCRRLDELDHGAPEKWAGERKTLERGHAGSVLRSGRSDERYLEYRRIYRETYGPMQIGDVQTAAQQEEQGRKVNEVIRRMMRMDKAA